MALSRIGLRSSLEIVPESSRPPGTNSDREEWVTPIYRRELYFKASEKYRLKALTCEKLASEAPDEATQVAWEELAVEWHILASRTAEDDKDVEKEC